jgi:AraC-like DNA-binding protein
MSKNAIFLSYNAKKAMAMEINEWDIRLDHLSFQACDETWSFAHPQMRDYDLLMFEAGGGVWEGPDGRAVTRDGTCVLLGKGKKYTGKLMPGAAQKYIFIHFDYVDKEGRIMRPPPEITPDFFCAPHKFGLLYSMAQECHESYKLSGRSAGADLWLKTIITGLLKRRAARKGEEFDSQAQKLERLCLYISENTHRKWTLESMASEMNYSKDHFAVIFKKYMRVSPGDWVIRRRIDRAKILLSQPGLNISETAERLGYCDIHTFSKQFKQITGISPGRYRTGR